MVIERPAAATSGASLQSLPGAVDHRPCSDCEDGADCGVDGRRATGDELWAIGLDANLRRRSHGCAAHAVDRTRVQLLLVVRKCERAQSLASRYCAIEIFCVEG